LYAAPSSPDSTVIHAGSSREVFLLTRKDTIHSTVSSYKLDETRSFGREVDVRSYTVMVVEDEPTAALDISHRLKNFGYQVPAVVKSGEEALELAQELNPDIVLMDIVLEGAMDGIEAAAEIRSNLGIPVVYLTSHADDGIITRAKITDPFGYIIKPCGDRELRSTVEMAVYKYENEQRKLKMDNWLSNTLRSISDGVITTDAQGRITYMNAVAESLTGIKLRSAAAKALQEVLKLSGSDVLDIAEEIVANKRMVSVDRCEILLGNGKELPVEVFATPMYADNESLSGIVVTFHDITGRLKAEKTIVESENRFRNLYENIPVGYICLDEQGQFIEANTSWLETTGYKRHEILGMDFEDFILEQDHTILKDALADLKESGSTGPLEISARCKDGRLLVVSFQGRRENEEQSGEQISYCIVQDITEKKKNEELLHTQSDVMHSVLESLTYPFYVVNAETREVEMANSAARGVRVNGSSLRPWNNRIAQNEGKMNPLDIVKVTGKAVALEQTHVNDRGERRHLEVHAYPVFDGADTLKRVIEYAFDITDRKEVEEALKQSIDEMRLTLEETVYALGVTSEKRDPYTHGHQQRVAKLACAIGERLGVPQEQIEGIRVASLLHDIGKIYIPAEILSKPARLTNMEFGLMQSHPEVGHEILNRIPFPWPVADVVLQHHERLDGSGYPGGLDASKILDEAKIVAVADVVEAMSSHRPYRAALGLERALEEISSHQGTIYDTDVVDACLELFYTFKFTFQ
jgi:PAS domain S-box-containing protein/putative nucleotidyltransferase with HDIG domain